MTYVHLANVNVKLPIYDSGSLRLIRIPSFRKAKVGTQAVTQEGRIVVVHALSDLNLELKEGDRVCLIGHNGAGKTTLLRLIAGIYAADTGSVAINGSIHALLGASMALTPDATGYENIRLIANLYHWPKAKMAEHIRDIEEFTDLGEYLSLPTRVYSAGMQSRLAFAIATTHAPDILLIDEGIGAGDAQFQEKAQARVKKFLSTARIILLASHSPELCRAICNKALLLARGRRMFYGGIDEGYEESQGALRQASP
jgi:ABC-2 type transport system ATP-binding protein/lipopolysaccharide transport system ATP-binding protein